MTKFGLLRLCAINFFGILAVLPLWQTESAIFFFFLIQMCVQVRFNFFFFLVIMLMTGSSFLLTPQSGEKLIINGFAIIGSFMYLIYFSSTLPFHSTEVPIIGKTMLIFLSSLIVVVAEVLQTGSVLNVINFSINKQLLTLKINQFILLKSFLLL